MHEVELAEHLAGLDTAELAAVLANRSDTCVEPVPADLRQLAQRLGNRQSVSHALRSLDRDAVRVGQTVAVLGPGAGNVEVARTMRADPALVDAALDRLVSTALLWPSRSGGHHMVDVLAEHWLNELRLGRRASALLPKLTVEPLRVAATGLGIDTIGLRKGELVDAIGAAMADADLIVELAGALPASARELLDALLTSSPMMFGFSWSPRSTAKRPIDVLVERGLVLPVHPGQHEIPREVGLALRTQHEQLTGAPKLARSSSAREDINRAAAAAAGSALAAVTALLDEARDTPIAILRSGGVGPKERKRLMRQLECTDDEVVLWIDLTHAARLLAEDERGYLPTSEYDRWRAEEPAARWSELLVAWQELEHAPFARQVADDKQHPPPLPLASGAGLLRRTLLRVCAESDEPVSVRGVAEVLDWWCPLAGYQGEALTEKVDAVVAEAERLGVIALDALATPGSTLARGDEDGLRDAAAELLPPVEYGVTLQSDLTAVVVGEPPASLISLLNSVATLESRGTARSWRFSPDSVRAGFDTGITKDELLDRLNDVARHGVPQPLEYLVADVARKYGSVTVSAALCCVRADETQVAEILATKALRKLRLVQLAPTVLASPKPLTEVLDALRRHGLAPIAEDTAGNRMVQEREDGRAAAPAPRSGAARARLTPEQLVERLRKKPKKRTGGRNATATTLAEMNPTLIADEVEVLADAIEANRAVMITYHDNNGKVTHRKISELTLSARWLEAWCHLRQADRVFAVSHILSVSPA